MLPPASRRTLQNPANIRVGNFGVANLALKMPLMQTTDPKQASQAMEDAKALIETRRFKGAGGTPGGVGAKRQPPLWLQPGDVVEVEISSVGTLTNRVAQEED